MLERKYRFNRKSEVERTLKTGKNIKAAGFSLRIIPNTNPKLAIVVSKKTEKTAVGRNLIRRRLFEVAKLLLELGAINGQTVLIVHDKELGKVPFEELKTKLTKTLQTVE